VAFYIASRTSLDILRKFTFPLLILATILLVILYIPGLGIKAGGAVRWLKLGGFRIGQPSELAKLAIILYLAHSLERKSNRIRTFSVGYLPHVVVACAFVVLLMLQPDFSTSIVIVVMAGAMLFIAGVPMRFLLGSVLLVLPVIYMLLIKSSYRWQRIIAFLYPDAKENVQNVSYQINKSFMAFSSGGFWGLGLGGSQQKLSHFPESHTDFIFAIMGEELGLLGVFVFIGLILLLLYRGYAIALRCNDLFGRYLAYGLTSMIVIQTLINIGVVMGSLPTTGMPLPFISFARSSLIIALIAVGILMQIEHRTRQNLVLQSAES
jgi:cell division protein FtsW